MSDLVFARSQMAVSLAFHIVFAAIGIAMPLLMVLAEWRALRTGDKEWLLLAKRWAKGTAVFFAVGAVSGTALSFELGLLFPTFMQQAGPLIGMPFSLEGFAFFTEAIFLGVYLYGWDRVRPALHLAAGGIVALSGLASALFVTLVNAWMNTPRGYRLEAGRFVDIDPLAAMATPFAFHEVVHTLFSAYMATAFAVAAIHAHALLKHPNSSFHRKALTLALWLGIPSALAQPLIGHYAAQQVAQHQPLKLAAMEWLLETQAYAPLKLGPIEIPAALSVLAFNDPAAVVQGLNEFPRADWPAYVVRIAFQIMIGLGSLAALYAAVTAWFWLRRATWWQKRWWLWSTVLLGPSGVIAMEAGWTVTEVGRQPWVIYGVLRTRDAVTPMPNLWLPFVGFVVVYLGLAVLVTAVVWRHVRGTTEAT